MKLVRIIKLRKKYIYINNIEGFLNRVLNIKGELYINFNRNLIRNNS